MLSKYFKVGLVVLVIVGTGFVAVRLRMENARLRQRIVAESRKMDQLENTRSEIRRQKEIMARTATNEADAAAAIHAELLRAREEVAALEQRARHAHTQTLTRNTAETAELDNNRDPEKGLMRVEHFKNAGQATPSAAFQTVVWAALKGEETELARRVSLAEPARAKAQALIDRLPEGERGNWTPEKVGGMFLSALLTEVPALQLLETGVEVGGQRATLQVRVPQPSNGKATQRVPMQRGPEGWQVIVSEGQIERVVKKIQGTEYRSPTN